MVDLLSLYEFIPPADKQLFKTLSNRSTCKKGDFLLLDGDIQEELYCIKSGIAFLYLELEHGLKVIDFAYHNRFCADVSSFSNQIPASYCIQCLEDCEIESIRFIDLQQIFNASPATERAYRIVLEKVLTALLNKCLLNETKSIKERFQWIMHQKPELFRLVPHKYIASYIHIDPTNFSKLYNQYCIKNGLHYE